MRQRQNVARSPPLPSSDGGGDLQREGEGGRVVGHVSVGCGGHCHWTHKTLSLRPPLSPHRVDDGLAFPLTSALFPSISRGTT